jgi:hypothetical protein
MIDPMWNEFRRIDFERSVKIRTGFVGSVTSRRFNIEFR